LRGKPCASTNIFCGEAAQKALSSFKKEEARPGMRGKPCASTNARCGEATQKALSSFKKRSLPRLEGQSRVPAQISAAAKSHRKLYQALKKKKSALA
jgi:hypothetical protein